MDSNNQASQALRRPPSERGPHRLFFDRQDYKLLKIVNDVLERGAHSGSKRLLAPYLHPHGIKEMAATRGLRIAYSVINLLGSLERGKADDRLEALRSLRDEVLTAPESSLQKNTARVLIQIMKELVRAGGDEVAQLKLAHDFRRAASGKPRLIRTELERRHLLETPEEWNQVAFDDHVHDANTKGRKSPTHLIMDGWIKGIRKLTVVYYNHVQPEVVSELLQAARIMGLSVRIGIEFRVRFADRFHRLLWTPRGFTETADFLEFLAKPPAAELTRKGKEASRFQEQYVLRVLKKFNEKVRFQMGEEYGIDIPPINEREFLIFVGTGQTSMFHLGRFIHTLIRPEIARRALDREISSDDLERLNSLDAESIMDKWLGPDRFPELTGPGNAPLEELPELMRLSPRELAELISSLHYNSWLTLDLSELEIEDLLILLYECRGLITHLEMFNLKHFENSGTWDNEEALNLQYLINSGNVVQFKKFFLKTIDRLEKLDSPAKKKSLARLKEILEDFPSLQRFYRHKPLRTRLGADSTGQSRRHHGMGFVVKETLPRGSQRRLSRKSGGGRLALPIGLTVTPNLDYAPSEIPGEFRTLIRLIRKLPGLGLFAYKRKRTWIKRGYYKVVEGERPGNIFTLGGVRKGPFVRKGKKRRTEDKKSRISWRYLNSNLKNGLKILAGFIPAALSFYFTKDWWLLAWFGPVIWFAITGMRNIIQSVLGCGGLSRSPLLKWNDYVSWERLADSLFYTGFSVPLLDWLVKSVLLDQGMGVNTTTAPATLYTVMAVVNGGYISLHNTLRGLPKKAAVGNFFRSVLSIPLAVGFNAAVGAFLGLHGAAGIEQILQKWAAIISKLASDCVAGVIEGLADRSKYVTMRLRDLKGKFKQLYDTYAALELLYPQEDVVELLESPKAFIETISTEKQDLEKIVIVNGLDFLYFWYYQPRSRTVLRRMFRAMTTDERKAFLLSQYVLQREKEISLLFIEGLVGRHFAKALSFYLDQHQQYLTQIQNLALKYPGEE